MPKDPFRNYLWVIEKLMRRPMTFSELADSYEVSNLYEPGRPLQKKTFYNWRDKIFDIFNVKINYDGEVYRIVDAGEPERKAALDWLIQSLSVNTAVSESRNLANRIILEDIPSGKTFLQPIIDAMDEGKQLRILYTNFRDRMGKDAVVEPYCLKLNNRRWYMLCRVPDGRNHHEDYPALDRFGCIRIYALDRIMELEKLDTKFDYPEDFDPDELFRDHFGVCIAYGIPLQRIVVRIEGPHRDYIDTLPLHHSQRLLEENDEYGIYEFRLHPTIDFFRAMLSFGADAEILEPTNFRELFAKEISLLNDIYSGAFDEEEN